MAEKKQLLVIGGTGFIGHHLLHAAKEKKWDLSCLSLHPPKHQRYVTGVEYHHADLLVLNELESLLSDREFDYVVNLGGYIDHTLFKQGGRQLIEEHFVAVQNLLAVLSRERLKAYIHIGSSDEYGNASAPQNEKMRESPISPYSLGKVAATHFLQMLHRTESFPATILRLFLTYGPGQNNLRFLPQIIKDCLNNQSFPTSAGEQLRDFCYVEDVVNAILLSLENTQAKGEVLNIASGQPVTIRRMIEIVREIIGKGEPVFGKIPYRKGENMCLYADTNKAHKILGWTPNHSLQSGLNNTISWYRDHEG